MLRTLATLAVGALGQCPNNGPAEHGRCWYLSAPGVSCGQTCQAQGLSYDHFVAGEASPMVPKLLGREPRTRQAPWGRIECYVAQGDRYHTAKANPDGNTGDRGEPQDWGGEGICQMACACASPGATPTADPAAPYPDCVQQGQVLRHAGAHAVFVDVSSAGSQGCWQNDCKNSDKFNAVDMGICARMCADSAECTHWTYGEQEGMNKCFFRKSDGGREQQEGFVAAAKSCAPARLPDAFVALKAGEVLAPCDAGKSDACPDIARAVSTWKFAIKHLKKAVEGQVDASIFGYVQQIDSDTNAFAAQMSEENFPVIAANNRQVFNVLNSWLQAQPGLAVSASDASLPAPIRGQMCGPNHCYEL